MSVDEKKNGEFVIQATDFKEVKYIPTDTGKLEPVVVKQSDTFFLYFTILTGTLPMFIGTAGFAWPSPVIPKYLSNDTNLNPLSKPITTMEISLLVGLPALTGLIGSLFAAPYSDKVGRKKSLQIVAPAMIICNLIIAYSTMPAYIIIARCITFITLLASMTIMQIFITEVCEDHNRAKFGCFLGLVGLGGTLFTFVFGALLNVRNFTLISIIPSILFLVLSFFIPESPVFSLSKGRDNDCMDALKKLRSNKTQKDIQLDFNKIKETLQMKYDIQSSKMMALFKKKESRIGLLLIFIPTMLQLFSGMPVLLPFLGSVFNESESTISGDTIAICSAVLKFFLFAITFFIVEKTGRKPLLIFSSIGSCISLTVLGLCFYLKHINYPLTDHLNWLPLISFALYICSYSLGIGVIPASLVGEMFTIELRAAASSFTVTSSGLIVFLLTSAFPVVVKIAGIYLCFWIFAFNCFLGGILIYILLPETRGKSVMEIQEILKDYKFNIRKT